MKATATKNDPSFNLKGVFGLATLLVLLAANQAHATVYEFLDLECRITNPVTQNLETVRIYSDVSTLNSQIKKVTQSGQKLDVYSETDHSFVALAPINDIQERVRFHGTINLRNGSVSNVQKRGPAFADGVKFLVSGNAELNIGGAYYSRVADPYEYTRAVPQAIIALDALNIVRPGGGLKLPLGSIQCKGVNALKADPREQG